MHTQSVGVVILTLNAGHHLDRCLKGIKESVLAPKILIVDSSSEDQTVAIAKNHGIETIVIKREDFNHGATREFARKHLNTDIVVMVTPDAYTVDNTVLELLVRPIINRSAVVAYARQIPHDHAGFFEAFPRKFNYPEESQIRSIEDHSTFGAYTYFCSNSFAAYLNTALDEIGGFKSVLLGEDTVAVAMLLHKGYKVAYVAEALVKHSHCYTLRQEFSRYFDTGYARVRCPYLSKGGDGKRGKKFCKEMIKQLAKNQWHLLPYALLQCGVKWLGYRLGASCHNAPLAIKKKLSSFPGYWTSRYYTNERL